ncbi:Protein of unknown function (DUF616) [Aequorivita sublithincola DSM 14238]|uniref:TOD1/MUCI70 glycosyltransferase-like domain-containing protein n=1 Tax=Aequorivita sublithincola (strain DSM 14238 / LMG 21431 / ACAM 643 / 9-3) TaxID=746697 RepID=I3YXH3_AEQSU|nr:glycosyltransferase domain-containing protein [Aequorivita sublithincola]AFL81691.1 Protein of unknown function (DUF616) [Aequorivita sublithincola DSM 14238]
MKIAIYTSIFGDKDEIRSPLNYRKSAYIDYYLITDNRESIPLDYNIIYKEPIFDDITKNARYYKINGLEIFKNYDYVIWHDANLQIVDNEIMNILDYVWNKGIAFFQHPERNCTYDEAIKCIELEKDYPFKIFRQIYFYFKLGLKNDTGLYATGLFVKNNKLADSSFLYFWWNEIKSNSRRDQLSLPYALKKYNIRPGVIEGDIRNNKYSFFHQHKHREYRFLSTGKSKLVFEPSKFLTIKLIQLFKRLNKLD